MSKDDILFEDKLTSEEISEELDTILVTNFQNQFKEDPPEAPDDDNEHIEYEFEDDDKGGDKEPKSTEFKASDMLDGALMISLIDMILPEIACFVYNKYVRKGDMKKATSSKIRLKQTQINQLKPLADAMLSEMDIKANPAFLFAFGLLSIYTMNLVHLSADTK